MTVNQDQLVFVGFNSRVIALDQNTGQIAWHWVAAKGSGYVSLLLNDDQHLIVSVQGYTYCLDPATGKEMWFNELKGQGTGVASIAGFGGPSSDSSLAAAAEEENSAATAATTLSATT